METLFIVGTFLISTFASFVGTNTGGTGLVIVPILLLFGLPPHLAVGSSRAGSLGGTITGIFAFHRLGKIDYRIGIPVFFLSSLGAFIGSHVLLATPGDLLKRILAVFILFMLTVMFFKRDVGVVRRSHRGPFLRLCGYASFVGTGFWAAYVGGGAGILDRYTLVFLFGRTLIESSGIRKIAGIGMVITATSVYTMNGNILWHYAIAVFVGSGIGAYVGSVIGIRKGEAWVRPLFIGMTAIAAILMLLR